MGRQGSNVEAIFRLTPAQEGVLFHAIQAPDSGVYFQQFTCLLRGELDVADFERAWRAAVARHPGARALFTWEGREHPLQVVLRDVDLPFEVVDDAELVAGGDALEELLARDRRRGFRLDEAPLMRVTVARGSDGTARLVWSFHHVLLDGWSMRLLLTEVLDGYATLRAGGTPVSASAPRFEDHVSWLSGKDAERTLAFWRDALAGFDAPTNLRLARPAGAADASGRAEHAVRLDPDATRRVLDAARAERITPNTLLRAAWTIVLGAHAGSDDVVFGATVSGRPPELDGVEDMVGMFINTVPVRARIDREAKVGDWLRALQSEQVEAAEHDWAPLATVQRDSDVPAGASLFDTILVFENHAVEPPADPAGLSLEDQRFVEHSNFPLAILALPGDELELVFVHDPALFDTASIERVARATLTVLERLASDPSRRVDDVSPLSDRERAELAGFREGGAVAGDGSTVVDRFREACRRPSTVFVLADDGPLLGEALEPRVDALAHELIERGVGRGVRVGILLDRGPEMVVAILATLAARAAYVPLDPDAPSERNAALLDETGTAVVLTTNARRNAVPGGSRPVVAVDDERPDAPARPPGPTGDDLAYVLFTSGSTGRPKGVEVTHANLAASTAARDVVYDAPVARFLLLSPYHFDSSVAGIFWALSTGGTLVLPPPGLERDVRALVDLIARERVTHTLCLPSLWELVLEVAAPGELDSMKTVIVAGESCPTSLFAAHRTKAPHASLVNEYGPTEGTVWATAHTATGDETGAGLPIGRPIPGTVVDVVDARGRAVPIGAPGEIVIGGAGVALSYHAQPERTAERFVELAPLGGTPERFYRTGDLARFGADGTLEFLGRADGQVKIRGQRIELGEIEAAARALDAVRDCVVVARMDEERRTVELAAYVVPASIDADALRADLAAALPEAMVPRHVVALDSLPRTSTGKVDRNALPEPERPGARDATVAPATNQTEATLLGIWKEVLGLDDIGVASNLFEVGGDSLMSIRIIARAHREGLRVDPARFAADPTVAGMAAAVEGGAESEAEREPNGPVPLTPIQRWFFSLDLPERHHWNLATTLELPPRTSGEVVRRALAAVVAAHDALRLRFAQENGTWEQELADAAAPALDVIDLEAIPAPERDAERARCLEALQRDFALDSGQLLRAALLLGAPGDLPRLVLVAHHLVVDAVSWGLLRDDVLLAVERITDGDPPALPPAGSFAGWARRLADHAASGALDREAEIWNALPTNASRVRLDNENGRDANLVEREEIATVSLDADATRELLADAASAYRANVNEVLLTAFALAARSLTNRDSLVVDVEGHGREPILDDVDLTRTVGWLTAVRPVELTIPSGPSPGDALMGIKELVRRAPNGGVGFGLLPSVGPPPRDVLFNYLGREVDAFGSDDVGPLRSRLGRRAYVLEVNAMVVDGRLTARFSFSPDLHRRATVEALASRFVDELAALVAHCVSPDAGGATPSDFPLAGLDQSGLDKLAELLGDD